jgi:hypothetical protein
VATVACWAITIVVPVLDSGEPDSLRIRVTSLGYSPIDMNDLDEAYLLLWAVVLIVAVTAWLLEASRWWSVAAIVLGTVLSLRLLQMIVDPPYLVWEGQTSSGTPTGGMEVAYPGTRVRPLGARQPVLHRRRSLRSDRRRPADTR